MILIEMLSHWNQQENYHGLQQDKSFIPVLVIDFLFPHKWAHLPSSIIFFHIPSAKDETTVQNTNKTWIFCQSRQRQRKHCTSIECMHILKHDYSMPKHHLCSCNPSSWDTGIHENLGECTNLSKTCNT